MDDLVGRLRSYSCLNDHMSWRSKTEREAATRITQLEAENERLRAELRALTPFTTEEIEVFQKCFDKGLIGVDDLIKYPRDEQIQRARAALARQDG